ncbi:hypothetical protein HPB47_015482 [Ixodes persulcatus]|uniref:Uncharacterized protein n=1 Tax=Ixodes persulcatus TaxID=34615 RepID=A0AC60QTG2_IXOPE|nr:hypothetical protein HPB47_015482 [Ixodes persulcatus]
MTGLMRRDLAISTENHLGRGHFYSEAVKGEFPHHRVRGQGVSKQNSSQFTSPIVFRAVSPPTLLAMEASRSIVLSCSFTFFLSVRVSGHLHRASALISCPLDSDESAACDRFEFTALSGSESPVIEEQITRTEAAIQDATPAEQFLGVTARFWRELVENLFSVTCAVCDRLWFAGDVSMIGGVSNMKWETAAGALRQCIKFESEALPSTRGTISLSDIEAFMIDVFGWAMLGDNTSVVVTGYFNVDIARQEGKRFTSFVLECFGLACVNKPTVRTARHRTCIDLVFTKNVPAVSVHLMAVYHSDHKAMVQPRTLVPGLQAKTLEAWTAMIAVQKSCVRTPLL